MSTLAQMQTALQARGYTSDTATQQAELLNSQYRDLCGFARWPFLEKINTALATVNAAPTVALSGVTDLLNVDAVRITQGTNYWTPEYQQPQDLRSRAHVNRTTGLPRHWTVHAGVLQFYPIPDGVYSITLDYIAQPAALTANDSPVFPAVYHDVLVWGAIAEIAARERDWNMATTAENRKETLLKRMQQELMLRQRQTSSRVRRA